MHTKKIALLGILAALAIALSFAESFLIPLLPLGLKPGLSNVAVMLASGVLGFPAGLVIVLIKAVFAGAARGLIAMLLSGAGGIVSALLVGFLLKLQITNREWRISELGIGMLGGVTHNLMQLLAAALLLRASGVLGLLPLLTAAGLAAGAVTGLLLKLLRRVKILHKL
jgi:heptaprenyl diphosphate synthase